MTPSVIPGTPLERVVSDELKSGLKVKLIEEAGELYAWVSWIAWDSPCRDGGLEVSDRIRIDDAFLT